MAFPVVTASGVIRGGRLVIHDRKAFDSAVRGLKDGWEVDLEISRFRATRSLQQNAYYHAVVLPYLSAHTQGTVDVVTWHDMMKVKFLSREEVVKSKEGLFVDKFILGTSTRGLDVQEFDDYLERIRLWAAESLGLYIPVPNEPSYVSNI